MNYQPPQQPAPRKRHRVRNTILAGLGAVVLLIIVISVASGGGGTPSPSAPPAQQAAKATPAKTIGVGSKARDGKFEFTVTSVSQQKSVGDTSYGGGQTAQGEYTILHVTVTNISDAPQTLSDTDQYVFDGRSRKFNADSQADIQIGGLQSSNNVLFQDINPGNTVSGQLAFDLPHGSTAARAELHDSPFSGGVAVSLTSK